MRMKSFKNKIYIYIILTPGANKGGGGGGVVDATPPLRFLLNFSETNYYPDLPFSIAVCISLRHILKQVC